MRVCSGLVCFYKKVAMWRFDGVGCEFTCICVQHLVLNSKTCFCWFCTISKAGFCYKELCKISIHVHG